MKVKALIEALKQLDPELEVYVRDPGCGCCSSGDEETDDVKVVDIPQPLKWVKNPDPKPFEDTGKWVEQPPIKGVKIS